MKIPYKSLTFWIFFGMFAGMICGKIFGGSSLFHKGNPKNPASLAVKIRDAGDPVSEYIREQFSTRSLRLLDAYSAPQALSDSLHEALVDELNQLLMGKSLYDEDRFAQVTLSRETQESIGSSVEGDKLIRLNRILLDDAYPQEIDRSLYGRNIVPLSNVLQDIFLKFLRMAIMPLIIVSITSGVISVGRRKNLGLLGAKTFGYYISTSLMAILTGQVLVNIFKPGVGAEIQFQEAPAEIGAIEQGLGEIVTNIIPANPFHSMANGEVLPIVFFSILFGYFVTRLQESHITQIGSLFEGLFDAMMKMTRFIIWTAPLGVFGINAKIVATTGFGAFKALGFYFIIVLIGLAVHGFVTLPLLMRFITGRNPLPHYKGMWSTGALATAFGTCSTVVTLPLTIRAVTEHSGASKKIASFVLPLGATINMDGTALYECIAVIFIAQVYGFELTFAMQLTIVITALLASIGAASVPMSGLVMMTIILGAVGLPLEGVALILAVDRVLDMFRTTINVFSDSCGTVVVAKLEGEQVLTPGAA